MVLLVAHNVDNGYTTSIRTAYNTSINLKFDSGASFTTIPYELIKDMIADNEKYKFTYYNENITFKTASSTDVIGALCSVNNIWIGAIEFPRFYFYMTFNTGRDIGLLGYEVIDNLNFSHEIGGNILVNEFDRARYDERLKKLIQDKQSVDLSLSECYRQYARANL